MHEDTYRISRNPPPQALREETTPRPACPLRRKEASDVASSPFCGLPQSDRSGMSRREPRNPTTLALQRGVGWQQQLDRRPESVAHGL